MANFLPVWITHIASAIVVFIASVGLFSLGMNCTRRKYFTGDKKCKQEKCINRNQCKARRWKKVTWGPNDDTMRQQQVEYHNNAIYKALEYYITVELTICGGIAIMIQGQYNLHTKDLFAMAGLFVIINTIVFFVLVMSHQTSKIRRWKCTFENKEILTWSEFWLIGIVVTLGYYISFLLIPRLGCFSYLDFIKNV